MGLSYARRFAKWTPPDWAHLPANLSFPANPTESPQKTSKLLEYTMATRILFVDDEAGIRKTLQIILEQHGFQVTAAATVPEALEHLNHATFDVLLSDLNIGQPGDGFTVVSAMRRV